MYLRNLLLAGIISSATAQFEPFPDASKSLSDTVAWSNNLASIGERKFSEQFGKCAERLPSPMHWSDHSVYEIFVDRFNNGDASNDALNKPQWQLDQEKNGNLANLYHYRHGGDLQGIIDRLDYIDAMGFKQLWITPFLLNQGGDYHYYCVSNFLQVDPSVGTLETYQELVRKAHERGIRVIMDLVVNHMCNPETNYDQEITRQQHEDCSKERERRNWCPNPGVDVCYGDDVPVSDAGILEFGSDFFPPLKNEIFFNRCGANSGEDTSGDGAEAVYGDFVASMKDFHTSNPDFKIIFSNMMKYWIAVADVDGFRLDAVKHVTEDFISYFAPEIRAYAQSLGKENFYIIGEVAASPTYASRFLGKQLMRDPLNPLPDADNIPVSATNQILESVEKFRRHPNQQYSGLTAVYDFTHSGLVKDVFRFEDGKDPIDVENYLKSNDRQQLEQQADDINWWILLEIHDWERFVTTEKVKRNSKVAISGQVYLNMARGIPITYYGLEQGFNGNCVADSIDDTKVGSAAAEIETMCSGPLSGKNDGFKRQCMWEGCGWNLGSTVPSINDLSYIGNSKVNARSADWESDPFLDMNNEVSIAVRKLQSIRKSCAAVRRGTQHFRWVSQKDAVQGPLIAFSRVVTTSEIDEIVGQEVIVIINGSDQDDWQVPGLSVDPVVSPTGTEFSNLLDEPGTWSSQVVGGKVLTESNLILKPHEYAILVSSQQRDSEWNSQVGYRGCKPLGVGFDTSNEDKVSQCEVDPTQTAPPSSESTESPKSPSAAVPVVVTLLVIAGVFGGATYAYRNGHLSDSTVMVIEDAKGRVLVGGSQMVSRAGDMISSFRKHNGPPSSDVLDEDPMEVVDPKFEDL